MLRPVRLHFILFAIVQSHAFSSCIPCHTYQPSLEEGLDERLMLTPSSPSLQLLGSTNGHSRVVGSSASTQSNCRQSVNVMSACSLSVKGEVCCEAGLASEGWLGTEKGIISSSQAFKWFIYGQRVVSATLQSRFLKVINEWTNNEVLVCTYFAFDRHQLNCDRRPRPPSSQLHLLESDRRTEEEGE